MLVRLAAAPRTTGDATTTHETGPGRGAARPSRCAAPSTGPCRRGLPGAPGANMCQQVCSPDALVSIESRLCRADRLTDGWWPSSMRLPAVVFSAASECAVVSPYEIEEIFPDVTAGSARPPRRQVGSTAQGLATTLVADYTVRTRAWLPSSAMVTLLDDCGVSNGAARTAMSRL